MATLIDRILGMMTLEFIISSVAVAFIINVLAGVFLRRTIETPSAFKHRRIEQLKRQLDLIGKLHANSHQLLCFSFRGIGLAFALFVVATGVIIIPAVFSAYANITFLNNPPPDQPSCMRNGRSVPVPPGISSDNLSMQCEQEMSSYNATMAAYAEQSRQAALNWHKGTLAALLIGFAIGAASFVYAMGVYRTLYLVANYEMISKDLERLAPKMPLKD